MMYLLDTCAFLWALGDDPSLSDKALEVIDAGEGLFLSQTTLWEIAVKNDLILLTDDDKIKLYPEVKSLW